MPRFFSERTNVSLFGLIGFMPHRPSPPPLQKNLSCSSTQVEKRKYIASLTFQKDITNIHGPFYIYILSQAS